jgi:hypothetical protein
MGGGEGQGIAIVGAVGLMTRNVCTDDKVVIGDRPIFRPLSALGKKQRQ